MNEADNNVFANFYYFYIMYESKTHLSFDCYGTLIDWETGILSCFDDLKTRYPISLSDAEILKLYADFEVDQEHKPFRPYKEVLVSVMQDFAQSLDMDLDAPDEYALVESIKTWPPFTDSHEALYALGQQYKLVIISNIDDDLFAFSQDLLGVKFDHIFTAQQMGSYKPSISNFQFVQKSLNLKTHNWLHIAQSLYHDHIPASTLGIDSVWIKRPSVLGDQGIAPEVDLIPKKIFSDMASFSKEIIKME